MNESQSSSPRTKRFWLISLLLLGIIGLGAWFVYRHHQEQQRQAQLKHLYAKWAQLVDSKWNVQDVTAFLESLAPEKKKQLSDLVGKPGGNPKELAYHLLWVSSSAFTYPFKDPNTADYHNEILIWAARKNDVTTTDLSSFRIERELMKKRFSQLWDRLDGKQRTELLDKLKVTGLSTQQKAAIISGSGSAALGVLSTTVAFGGFAFYTTASTTLATAAGLLGITLPFDIYAGTASTVAILSGPVGWGIALVGGTGAVVWATAANEEKTTAFVLAIHALKAERAEEIAKQINSLGGTVPTI